MKTNDTTQTKDLKARRAAYIAQIKKEVDALNAKVDVMEAKMQLAKAEVRAAYLAQLDRLRAQSEQATDQLAQLQAGTEAGWDKMVLKMDKVRDAFVHALKDFKDQF